MNPNCATSKVSLSALNFWSGFGLNFYGGALVEGLDSFGCRLSLECNLNFKDYCLQ